MIGAVAALGLLVLVWLNSKKSSGTVAPASGAISTPAVGGGGGASPSASDVQAAITQALQGYAKTSDLQALGSELSGQTSALIATASSQLQQAEQQDQQTQTNNLQALAKQFSDASQQWAQTANQLTGAQQQQANQIAQQQQDISKAAGAGSLTAQELENLQRTLYDYTNNFGPYRISPTPGVGAGPAPLRA